MPALQRRLVFAWEGGKKIRRVNAQNQNVQYMHFTLAHCLLKKEKITDTINAQKYRLSTGNIKWKKFT